MALLIGVSQFAITSVSHFLSSSTKSNRQEGWNVLKYSLSTFLPSFFRFWNNSLTSKTVITRGFFDKDMASQLPKLCRKILVSLRKVEMQTASGLASAKRYVQNLQSGISCFKSFRSFNFAFSSWRLNRKIQILACDDKHRNGMQPIFHAYYIGF